MLVVLILISSSTYGQFFNDSSLHKFIDTWIGKPYKFGGNSEFGIDCSHFVSKLYQTVYEKTIKGTCYKLWKNSERVEKEKLQTGDLVFFNSKYSPSGWHVGVYLWDDKFIHAANRKEGVKISSLTESVYTKNYKGAGRF